MLTWKYTLPAFVVPLVFTLSPEGSGLLLQAPIETVAWTSVSAAIGIGAFAASFGGWIFRPASMVERVLMAVAGTLLVLADARLDAIGLGLTAVVVILHYRRQP